MEENGCNRNDGKGWRCGRPVMEGKITCEAHFLQSMHRRRREGVPDELLLQGPRRRKVHRKSDSNVPLKLVADKRTEPPVDVSDVPSRRSKRVIKEEPKDVVKHLKYGTLEIAQEASSQSTQKEIVPLNLKVGVPAPPRRTIRSKNVEPIPIATVQMLPNIKENIKASSKKKKKNNKKCHWCKLGSYCVIIKSTCNKHFFCLECINSRLHCKVSIKRECPVCKGTCRCDACLLETLKEVKKKIVYDAEEEEEEEDDDVAIIDNEKKFDKVQQLHVVRLLLPVMEKMNQEKFSELDIEAKLKGKSHDQLCIRLATSSHQRKCCFCSAWIADIHRSCDCCSYVLCINCCQEFRDGYIHSGLEDLQTTRMVRTKSTKISWDFSSDGSIRCPPRNLGGCHESLLELTCFSSVNWTKDLEASAKQIVCDFKSEEPFEVASLPCFLCDGNDEKQSEKVGNLIENKGLYFLTNQDFQDKNLEHFMKHWGNGQPLIIRELLQSQPQLSWDFGFLLCKYLEMSAESRKHAESGKSKSGSDWCSVQLYREQIFVGGKTHENVWQELIKFKVRLSSGSFQDLFPNHYAAVMQALPVQEYIDPLAGFLNLAANLPPEAQNPKLGPNIYISFGGPENLTDADLITRLCCHAYDMFNILAHASEHRVSEKKLNEVKILMHKYSSNDEITSSMKIQTRNKLEALFGSSSVSDDVNMLSDGSGSEDLDKEDFSPSEIASSSRIQEEQVVDRCGAKWDVFRREDVPKLVEFLNKYSNTVSKSNGSPEKVVHPIFDEIFYLDGIHKLRLKEEFNVIPWSFNQNIGDSVIIPAGCPYQVKKIKSCVHVALEFISPESASECIKVGDELRQLPVNHKAKAGMLEVKKMVISKLHSATEDFHEVSQTESRQTPLYTASIIKLQASFVMLKSTIMMRTKVADIYRRNFFMDLKLGKLRFKMELWPPHDVNMKKVDGADVEKLRHQL